VLKKTRLSMTETLFIWLEFTLLSSLKALDGLFRYESLQHAPSPRESFGGRALEAPRVVRVAAAAVARRLPGATRPGRPLDRPG
jgi:hypothetical protein